jgi:hypothetical protein
MSYLIGNSQMPKQGSSKVLIEGLEVGGEFSKKEGSHPHLPELL